jgi:MFS family permease
MWQAFRRNPAVFGAALIGGFVEIALWALLPLYAIRQGVDQDTALLLLTVFIVGSVALQWPLGWIADRVDRRRVLLACAGAALAIILALPAMVPGGVAAWLALPLLGAALTGFYTLGLALMGQRFDAAGLAAANTAFIMLCEAGSLSGPPLAGAAMDLWNPHGLILALAAPLGLLILLMGRRHLGVRW